MRTIRDWAQLIYVILISCVILNLAACKGVPSSFPVTPSSPSVPVGTVEMDQNTDPRFYLHNAGSRTIARIERAGNQVYVNNRPIYQNVSLRNNSSVKTGTASAARILFNRSAGRDCLLDITGFNAGTLYGNSERCRHNLKMQHGSAEPEGEHMEYLAVRNPNSESSRFIVIRGTAFVMPYNRNEPPRRVVPNQYVVLTPGHVSPPRYISPRDINRIRSSLQRNFRLFKARESSVPDKAVSTVKVPDLNQRTLKEVRAILKRAGLQLRYTPTNANDGYWVYQQTPAAGKLVRTGSTVQVQLQAPIL